MAETLEASENALEKTTGAGMERGHRAEIDTSVPFESVKEAATRFGGFGYWKPSNAAKLHHSEPEAEELDLVELEEQALFLEKDLMAKERDTLDVLKELEKTKATVEELKGKLQKEANALKSVAPSMDEAEKENYGSNGCHCNSAQVVGHVPSSAPGLILMELKQAKLNLSKTTTDLADIRTSVDSYNKRLERERLGLEKTRERLAQNSSKISALEDELNQTKLKLRLAKEASDNPLDISKELQRLSHEAEQFRKVGEAARLEIIRATREIEQTKTRVQTAETKLVAARKMKEAARAAEAAALAEIRAASNPDPSPNDGITLSYDEYSLLVNKAREAEELSKNRVVDAMQKVDDANVSKMEILKKVEEATKEIRTSKKALEDALNRVESANQGKLVVEEALRRWRSDHGQRRRSSVNNSVKFKNPSCSLSHHRRDSRLLDVNGLNLVSDGSTPVLKSTLSIGQILSRKLMPPEELDESPGKVSVRQKVSLGQMLSKKNGDLGISSRLDKENIGIKQFSGKRKKFGFARFSLLLAKQSKKKKKRTCVDLR